MRSAERKQLVHQADSQRIGKVDVPQLVLEAERRLAQIRSGDALIVPPPIFADTPRVNVKADQAPWLRELLRAEVADPKGLGLQLIVPTDGYRIRELISRSRKVMTGKYPSWKMGRFMHWESRLESKVFRLLDVCAAVKRFAEQPLLIRYLLNGEWQSHIPDVAVEVVSGDRWLLEIKSSRDPKLIEAIQRAEVIAPRLKLLGCKYAVIHQRDIEADMSVENACLLLKHGRGQPGSKAHQEFLGLLANGSRYGRKDLVGMLIEGEHAIKAGSQLALRGYVSPNWAAANTSSLEFCAATDSNIEEALQWLLRALGVTSLL